MKSKICEYLWFEQLLLSLHIRKMVIFQLGFQMGIRGMFFCIFFKIRLANKINYIITIKDQRNRSQLLGSLECLDVNRKRTKCVIKSFLS